MTLTMALDFAASLAIIALLAESYRTLRRRFFGTVLAPIVLGILFGLVGVIEMYLPLEPFDGVIIDMRCIPVALAGAFLGWRGLLPCLCIVIAARIGIGGVGATAGVASVIIAGLAGMIWSRKAAQLGQRNFGMLLLLALAMSTHMLGAVALPREMAVWFFTVSAAPILAVNLFAVTAVGALLERENRRIAEENRIAKALSVDPETGLLTPAAFQAETTSAFAAHAFGTFGGLMVIDAERSFWAKLLGRVGLGVDRMQGLKQMLDAHMEHARLAGRSADGRVLVPMSEREILDVAVLRRRLARDLEDVAAKRLHKRYRMAFVATPDPAEYLAAVKQAALSVQPEWFSAPRARQGALNGKSPSSPLRRDRVFDPAKHDALFAKAEYLLKMQD